MNISTTPVPNMLFDAYLKELKQAELKVLLIIIRQTLGWKDKKTKSERKELDWISGSQLALKTGSSQRAINDAIQSLVKKQLIEILSRTGEFLDSPAKRRGQLRLFYRLSSAIFADVNNKGIAGEKAVDNYSTYANFALN